MVLRLVFLILHHIALVSSLNDEGLALLSFKQSLDNSTAGSLDNWNFSDTNPCSWHGVICRQEKVVSIYISNKGLGGFPQLDGGKLAALRHVDFRNNFFSGSLPAELFAATGLRTLVLSQNSFSGPIPSEIGNLKYLQGLDLSQNSFNGSIPSSLVHCKRLKSLVLSQNSFTGSVPDGLGTNLSMLQNMNLSFNNFNNVIPEDMGNLSSIQGVLDLSHNHFNGIIPASLGNIPEEVYINLAYNNLSGPIPQKGALVDAGPTAFIGNPLLCGFPLKTLCPSGTSNQNPNAKPLAEEPSKSLGRRKHWSGRVLIVSASMAGICLIFFSLYCWFRKVYIKNGTEGVESWNSEDRSVIRKEKFCFRTDDLESLSETMEQYTFTRLDSQADFDLSQLLKASAFLLGKSRIGIVYKVVLERGPVVTVRRLENEGCQRFREFQSEVEVIGKISHPNIVRLVAYCWCNSEKLLIYDYVPNGDLSTAMHGRAGLQHFKPLSWSVRLKIMKGIAKGLVFLHEFSPKRYVHGNLKPSNILLGENMEPRISDFGLSRVALWQADESPILQQEQLTSGAPPQLSPCALTPTKSSTNGSFYEAPEASKLTKPSQKWDIYSFGVILLELISGKSAMQTGSSEMNLVQLVQLSIEVKPLIEVLDPFLARDLEKQGQMIAVLEIALACVQVNPDRRPPMRSVSDALDKLASSP
ncbi:hypothetical protein K2173_001248 [Erythroxylum novogranatense]|uniref:Protein kinase domain-containing protein n=1 Tax=Erythroxylum novogranatense TaxID=1862640 RepID=A0AAV8T3E2_9ROSI|nr:hypothetical protein K2173_001248 [Erythroxylum novogranatense]